MKEVNDTIVAPATPRGESAIGLIRLTGPASPALAAAVFGRTPTLREATYGRYRDRTGRFLDSVIYTLFGEGKSYTGESMLEIASHGNPFIQQKILADLHSRGARMAEPGEFTRRAFLNGRMDLSQAEAVADLIRARSDRALTAARRQLDGSLGRTIDSLIARLLKVTASLEAYIDFPEEDLPPEDAEGPKKELAGLVGDIDGLIATQAYTTMLHEGVATVILGEPNAGKSSLLNAIIGEDRAIVSEEPGTTRDYVEERFYLGSWLLRVVDTAGIHETAHAIEREGIARALKQMESADILLLVVDQSKPRPTLPEAVLNRLKPENTLIVENKSDLAAVNPEPWIPELRHLRVSALRGDGMEGLKTAIRELLESDLVIPDENAVLVSARHAEALKEAKTALETSLHLLRQEEPAELAASELHLAIEAMGRITGKIDNERMLDQLFANFCIGK